MNPVFNLQRLSLLVARHWAENRKRYVLSVPAFIGLLSMWFLFMALMERNMPYSGPMQRGTYFFCLLLGGALYASQHFRDLGNKPRAITYLMTPASMLEKLLCSLFFTLPVFFVVVTAAFYLVDVVAISLANVFHPAYNGSMLINDVPARAEVASVFINGKYRDTNEFEYVYLMFAALQGAFLLGSVYFPKYSFIKTVIRLAVLLFVFISFRAYFTSKVLPHGFFDNDLSKYTFNRGEIHLPAWIGAVLLGLLRYALIPFFWVVTYFRLQEKEV